jgi:hypothetical protein
MRRRGVEKKQLPSPVNRSEQKLAVLDFASRIHTEPAALGARADPTVTTCRIFRAMMAESASVQQVTIRLSRSAEPRLRFAKFNQIILTLSILIL